MPQRSVAETYDYIRRIAAPFSQKVTQSAGRAHNEIEFQHDMADAISRVAAELSVDLLSREQYTLATGRADAVYNRFIIEYERPGSLRQSLAHGHTSHAVQQVKDYIEGVARAERHDRDRLLGVAFDGRFYVFVRYHEGHFIVEEPLEANMASTERFLRSLFSLSSGRALISDNLVEDFGSQNIYSQRVTRALYNALESHTDDLTARLYQQWQLFFSEVAGYEVSTGQLEHKQELRSFARGMGLRPDKVDPPRFFFAIHTYFSFLVKNIARLILQAYAGGVLGATPLTTVASLQGEALRRELERLESGDIFRVLGLRNLLEGDFFSWYLSAWDEQIEDALRLSLGRLAAYNPVTVQDDPHSARDLLKKLYHYLLPREIRHDLGEFYTPDWLAERLLQQLNEPLFLMPKPGASIPKPNKRLLDPACGSGTFPILAARALKANCRQAGLAEADTLETILSNVAGIDLNPLAVMAARVNYLLAIADLLPYRRQDVEIPIYLADSIVTPRRGERLWDQCRSVLETAVGRLPVPDLIDSQGKMERLTDVLEEYVGGAFDRSVFLSRCLREFPVMAQVPESEVVLGELYDKLSDLHRRGLDGIWARVLKNAFMPLFLEPFDYIVGNPPWINWESLPQGYRDQSAVLWRDYGLFVHSGMDTILGKGKKDLSTLMTYAAAKRFLRPGGKLAFVITQSVWKTAGAAQGFRRFQIGSDGSLLRVLHVDDMSKLQVFEGASTRTSVFVVQKDSRTRYPVPYTFWQKTARGKGLDYDSTLEEVLAQTRRLNLLAAPVNSADSTSAWLTARSRALTAVQSVLGPSSYDAHAGVYTGGANGVYWLEVLATKPQGLVVVRNVTEGAKRVVDQITVDLEQDLIYPLILGRDVVKWRAAPVYHILLVQDVATRRGIDELRLQHEWPKTWEYLKRYEAVLRERAAFKRYYTRRGSGDRVVETGPFYSMFDVGDYTLATAKVVWTRIGNRIESAVIRSDQLPQETLTLVPTASVEEAHYVCALVNSLPFQFAAHAYSQAGGKSFGSPHLLENIRIPRYDPKNAAHLHLAGLSDSAHEVAASGIGGGTADEAELRRIEYQVDVAAAKLWGLSASDCSELEASLAELRGVAQGDEGI